MWQHPSQYLQTAKLMSIWMLPLMIIYPKTSKKSIALAKKVASKTLHRAKGLEKVTREKKRVWRH